VEDFASLDSDRGLLPALCESDDIRSSVLTRVSVAAVSAAVKVHSFHQFRSSLHLRTMSATITAQPTPTNDSTKEAPKKKICCACPDTKKIRDECIVKFGQEKCTDVIEAHKVCLRGEGFNV
jgi:cytochrome c oxidase assembly protein subunit 17